MSKNTVIKVEDVGKLYRLGEIGTGTISHDLNRWWARLRGKEDPFSKVGEVNDRTSAGGSEYVWALKDINFEIGQGEVIGIIGHNGAGKSTLLKILSKVTSPTTGRIKINGRIASLLEVGTGFHQELTGRENIFLNGAILGMRKSEIRSKFDQIVDFAGVEKYIDTPVKRYSSGMYVRLAFAVAAFLEPEILIIDEVLAVGDAEFQEKCLGRMQDVSKDDGRTIVFVSHDLSAVSRLCKQSLLVDKGCISYSGNSDEVISKYLNSEKKLQTYLLSDSEKKIFFSKIESCDEKGDFKSEFNFEETINFNIDISIKESISKANVLIVVIDEKKRRIFACESASVECRFMLQIISPALVRGQYSINAYINIPNIGFLDVVEDVCKFTVIDGRSIMSKHGAWDYGMVISKYFWR